MNSKFSFLQKFMLLLFLFSVFMSLFLELFRLYYKYIIEDLVQSEKIEKINIKFFIFIFTLFVVCFVLFWDEIIKFFIPL